ncbi:MAG: hypothetical protein L3K26_07005, partial [Candidatus Hydrogenedentes bacterium]|nr:hypothetical protein [Candidatus Hydrogenedentota bacterium]
MSKVVACCAVALATVLMTASALAKDLEIYKVTVHGAEKVLTGAKVLRDGVSPTKTVTLNGVTFNLYYDDIIDNTGFGFDDAAMGNARQASLEAALGYAADVLNQAGTLDVIVRSTNFGGGTLATAGTYFSGAKEFQNGIAFQRLSTGVKPFENVEISTGVFKDFEEIFINVDFHPSMDWYTGAGSPG